MITGMKMGSCMVEENQIKSPFKINSDKANSIIFPQVQAKGVENQHLHHPAKYKEMPTAKKIPIHKQEEETMW